MPTRTVRLPAAAVGASLRRRADLVVHLCFCLAGVALIASVLIDGSGFIFWENRLNLIQIKVTNLYVACLMVALGGGVMLLRQRGSGVFARTDAVPWLDYAAYGAAVVLTLAYVAARLANTTEYHAATMELLASGEAAAPFQYRALVPAVAGWMARLAGTASVVPAYAAVEALSAFGLFIAFAGWLRSFFGGRTLCNLLALSVFYPLLLTMAVSPRAHPFFFPGDTFGILVFTLGLWALHKRAWGWYYVIFLVGTFNRETTCFLTFIYCFTAFRQVPFRTLVLHGGAQLALWVGVKALLLMAYPDALLVGGEASVFINQLARNLDFLSRPLSYLYLAKVMGGLWIVVLLMARHISDGFVRRALWVCVPFGLGMSCVGLLAEVRIFGDLIPLFTLAFLLVLREIARSARVSAPVEALAVGA
jgi:hypothetical protein